MSPPNYRSTVAHDFEISSYQQESAGGDWRRPVGKVAAMVYRLPMAATRSTRLAKDLG